MVSVLIPTTTGGFKYISKLVPLLKKQITEVNGEILIAVNGANDGTEEYLRNQKIFFISLPRNTTFSQANNKLAQVAKNDLLLLNNDTETPDGFLKKMSDEFQSKKEYSIMGCTIYRLSDKRCHHAGVYFTEQGIPYELGLPVGDINGIPNTDPRVKTSREVPSVTGACMMIRKELYKKLGGLDEHYFTGWEDTDFVLRAREKGEKVWYCAEAHIYHHHFGSRDQGRLQHELQNRQFYDSVWVHTGRAIQILRKDNFL